MKFEVTIDGKPNVLVLENQRPGKYEYHTQDHHSSHSFPWPLKIGERFRTNGHVYEIKRAL